MTKQLLPCPECGAEAWGGQDTTVTIEEAFQFAGNKAVRELPGKVCPECQHEFAL